MQHVIPLQNFGKHQQAKDCWCHPVVVITPDGEVAIHNDLPPPEPPQEEPTDGA